MLRSTKDRLTLDMPTSSNETPRSQLKAVIKSTGKIPQALLDETPMPPMFEGLYHTFLDLKTQNLDGIVSNRDILDYQMLYNTKILKFEVMLIKNIDIIYRELQHKLKGK